MKTKVCAKCKNLFSVDNFHRARKSPDGLQSWCKMCARETDRNRTAYERIPDGIIVQCRICKKHLIASCFGRRAGKKNGLDSRCKDCRAKAYREKIHAEIPLGADEAMLQCAECQKTRPIEQFGIDGRTRNNISRWCKACVEKRKAKQKAKYKGKYKRYHRQYNIEHRDEQREYQKRYHAKNREKINARKREHSEKNREEVNRRARERYKENPARYKKYKAAWKKKRPDYHKQHLAANPQLRVHGSVASRMRRSLRNGKGSSGWESLVGYALDDLVRHLEKQFTDGMSWANYREWHIDHIQPVSAFNFEKPEDLDFKRCWALANLRPLWAEENQSKGNKIERPVQQGMIFG